MKMLGRAQIILLLIFVFQVTHLLAKVVDLGPKLPEYIDEHRDKSWLIKFYAPWCYHCQQLEPTYVNVAQRIYQKHDNLIVGRVDCTKYGAICEKYGVQSYPSIMYLNRKTHVAYNGDRSASSLIDFADRLNGPDLKPVDNCDHLRAATDENGILVLLKTKSTASELFQEFKALSSALKSTYWFYYSNLTCKNLFQEDGIYLLKRHLGRAVKFPLAPINEHFKSQLTSWLSKESFPVFGPINHINFDLIMASGKQSVIAVLDEYRPAKRFSQPSRNFYQIFERVAKKQAQKDDRFLMAWSSDLELIQSIVIGHVIVPNILLLKPDYSYHLLITDAKEIGTDENVVPEKLRDYNIEKLIVSARQNSLEYQGGDSHLYRVLRLAYNQFNRFRNMYSANPLLASILIGLPAIIVLFVIYTTCCSDGPVYNDAREDQEDWSDDEDEEDEEDEEERHLMRNHKKQD